MAKNIFIIEDDENIRSLIKIALEGYSYNVKDFETAEDGLAALEDGIPDLIIFDIMLPGMSGIDAVKIIKQSDKYRKIAVIMLTAKDSEVDKIRGLDNGADDYITKPFGIMELMARIRSVLRRTEDTYSTGESKLESGRIMMNLNTRETFADGENVALTYKEFEMLKFLMRNKNRVVSRSELLDKVWGYEYAGETRTVDIHIRTLRKKLGDAGSYIKTSRGTGYIFEVD